MTSGGDVLDTAADMDVRHKARISKNENVFKFLFTRLSFSVSLQLLLASGAPEAEVTLEDFRQNADLFTIKSLSEGQAVKQEGGKKASADGSLVRVASRASVPEAVRVSLDGTGLCRRGEFRAAGSDRWLK